MKSRENRGDFLSRSAIIDSCEINDFQEIQKAVENGE